MQDNFGAIKQHVLYEDKVENDTDDEEYPEDDYINYQQDVNEYRTCATIFRSIIRSDLIEYTHLLIEQTSTQCIQDVSNYTSNFSTQVFKVASLMFYEHKFMLDDGKVSLVHAGSCIEWLIYVYRGTVAILSYGSV